MNGTVQFNLADAINRPLFKKAMDLAASSPCESWCLVATKDCVESMEELKKWDDIQQKKLAKKDCQPFVTPP